MRKRFLGLAVLAGALFVLTPALSHAGTLNMLSSQLKFWSADPAVPTGGECELEEPFAISPICPGGGFPFDNATGGCTCYTKSVVVPAQNNVVYVMVSATGDSDGADNSIEEAVTLNGFPCQDGGNTFGFGFPTGWVPLSTLSALAQPTFFSDNNLTYQWCCALPGLVGSGYTFPTINTVAVKFANPDLLDEGFDEFVEQMTVTISSASVANANACTGQ